MQNRTSMNYRNELKVLADTGVLSSFDPTKLSNSTIKSVLSHIKVLKNNRVPVSPTVLAVNQDETIRILNNLVDRRERPLSAAYKRQIGMTIKRMYPYFDLNLTCYNAERAEGRRTQTRFSNDDFVKSMQKILQQALSFMESVKMNERIDDLGMYDTCLVILITITTSLRINEIRQLKMRHMKKIEAKEPITIHSKCSSNSTRVVAPNDILLLVFSTIKAYRHMVDANIRFKHDKLSKTQLARLDQNYMIISSADFMTKKLRELAAMAGQNFDTFGFNMFRKYITSVLVENGGHLIAQALNNHSSVNTTLDHYTVIGSRTAEKAYDDLMNKEAHDQLFTLIDKVAPLNAKKQKSRPTSTVTTASRTDRGNETLSSSAGDERVISERSTNGKNPTSTVSQGSPMSVTSDSIVERVSYQREAPHKRRHQYIDEHEEKRYLFEKQRNRNDNLYSLDYAFPSEQEYLERQKRLERQQYLEKSQSQASPLFTAPTVQKPYFEPYAGGFVPGLGAEQRLAPKSLRSRLNRPEGGLPVQYGTYGSDQLQSILDSSKNNDFLDRTKLFIKKEPQ